MSSVARRPGYGLCTVESTWSIERWQPRWHSSPVDIAEHEGTRLQELVDRTVARAWGVWIVEENEWFANLPVIVEIGSQRVTVCVNRLDDLSITWDDRSTSLPARPGGTTGPWRSRPAAGASIRAHAHLPDLTGALSWPASEGRRAIRTRGR